MTPDQAARWIAGALTVPQVGAPNLTLPCWHVPTPPGHVPLAGPLNAVAVLVQVEQDATFYMRAIAPHGGAQFTTGFSGPRGDAINDIEGTMRDLGWDLAVLKPQGR